MHKKNNSTYLKTVLLDRLQHFDFSTRGLDHTIFDEAAKCNKRLRTKTNRAHGNNFILEVANDQGTQSDITDQLSKNHNAHSHFKNIVPLWFTVRAQRREICHSHENHHETDITNTIIKQNLL